MSKNATMAEGVPGPAASAGAGRVQDAGEILRLRSERLRAKIDAEEARDVIGVLVFELASSRYAIETSVVSEVCVCERLMPLPCTPGFVLGVMNLHGEILAINDLSGRLGTAPGATPPSARRAVVLADTEMALGVAVDDVVGVAQLERDTIEPFAPAPGEKACDYVAGILPDGTVFLDGRKILEDPTLIVDDAA